MLDINKLLGFSILVVALLVVGCGEKEKQNTIDSVPSALPENVSKALESICIDNKFDKLKIFPTPGLCQFKGNTRIITGSMITRCSNEEILQISSCITSLTVNSSSAEKNKCIDLINQCKGETISKHVTDLFIDECEKLKQCELNSITDPAKKTDRSKEYDLKYCKNQDFIREKAHSLRGCNLEDIKILGQCLVDQCTTRDFFEKCYKTLENKCVIGN